MADLHLDSSEEGSSALDSEDSSDTSRRRRGRDDRSDKRAFWAELPFLIIVALVLAMLLKTFVVQAFYIPSSSMEPTLMVQDRVLVTKLAYLYREPRRGEIVVFRDSPEETIGGTDEGGGVGDLLSSLASGLGFGAGNERDFIKRIIGLPGETIEMRGGVVFIDGEPIPEAATADGGFLAPDPEAERQQLEGLAAWRAQRDGAAVERALAELKAAAAEGRNVMEPSIACAHAGADRGAEGARLGRSARFHGRPQHTRDELVPEPAAREAAREAQPLSAREARRREPLEVLAQAVGDALDGGAAPVATRRVRIVSP